MIFRLKARLLVGAVIPEQVKRKLINQNPGLTMEKVDELLKLDPTPKGSWMSWIIKWDKRNELPANIESLIQKFERMKTNWPPDDPRRNFGSLTPTQIVDITKGTRHDRRTLSKDELSRAIFEQGVPGAQMIVNDGPWKMWKVSNYKYLMILSGADIPNADAVWCKWCTKQEGYAKDYMKNGNVYPIFFNDKPFAQAHFGGSSNYRGSNMPTVGTIMLDSKDHKFEIGPEMKSLIDFLKSHDKEIGGQAWAWIQNMIITLDEVPSDPEMLEYAKQLAMEENYPRLKVMILKQHWWPEGFESLMDEDNQQAIHQVMDGATQEVKKQLQESEFGPEMIFYATKGTAELFPAFAKAKQYTAFFDLPFEGSKINLTTLGDLEKPTMKWILSLDYKGFLKVIPTLAENAPVIEVLVPVFWRKSMQPKGLFYTGKYNTLMEKNHGDEYESAKKSYMDSCTLDMSSLPEKLEEGATVKRGPTYENNGDLFPGNTGRVEKVNGIEYQIKWVGNPSIETSFYTKSRKRIDLLPAEAKYIPTGREPMPWSEVKTLLEKPEDRVKREKQPKFLPIGTVVMFGPDSGDYGSSTEGTVERTARLKGEDASGFRMVVKWKTGDSSTYTYNVPTLLPIVSKEHWENPDIAHPEVNEVELPKLEKNDLVRAGAEMRFQNRFELIGRVVDTTIHEKQDYARIEWFDTNVGTEWKKYEPDVDIIVKLPEEKQFREGCKVKDLNSGQTGTLIKISKRNNKVEGPITVLWEGDGENAQSGWFFYELEKIGPPAGPSAIPTHKVVSRYPKLKVGDAVQQGPGCDITRWKNAEGELMIGKVTSVSTDRVEVELEARPQGGPQTQEFAYNVNNHEVQLIPGIERPADMKPAVAPGTRMATWPQIEVGDWVKRGPNWDPETYDDLWMVGDQREPRSAEDRENATEALGVVSEVEDGKVFVKWGCSDDPATFDDGSIESNGHPYEYKPGEYEVMLVKKGSTGEIVEDGGVTYAEPEPAAEPIANFDDIIEGIDWDDRLVIEGPANTYSYTVDDNYLNCTDGGSNRAILNDVFGADTDAIMAALTTCYGYRPGGGDWPTFNSGDINAVRETLRMLVAHGCTLERAEEDE